MLAHRRATRFQGDRSTQQASDLLTELRGASALAGNQFTAPPQQMSSAFALGVVQGVIGQETVTPDDASVVAAQNPFRHLMRARGVNRVDRDLAIGKHPQPSVVTTDLPAGFIHPHHLAVAQLKNQIIVGRLQLLSQPRVRPDDGRAFDRQLKRAAQHTRGFAIRHAQAVFHLGRQTNGVRPNLNRGRAQRIRGLFCMTPLHSALAALTMPHMHIELGDYRGNGTRNIHLILHFHRVFDDATPTVRTTRRQGRFFHMIHMIRRLAMGGAVACLLPRWLGPRLRSACGKGRGLALARPFGLVQLALQFRHTRLQPLEGHRLLGQGRLQLGYPGGLLLNEAFSFDSIESWSIHYRHADRINLLGQWCQSALITIDNF